MADLYEPHELERLRRSIAMLGHGRPDGLDRDRALRIIGELQRARRRMGATRNCHPAAFLLAEAGP
jgi:hypothetical protein